MTAVEVRCPSCGQANAPGAHFCSNCGAPLAGPYCGSCGQKTAAPNPAIGDFLHELSHELLHVDGKIFRSLRLLVAAPGALTREQFEGRRVRYISPIRLYLTFSVVYFAVAALTPAISFRITVGGQETHQRQRAGQVSERRHSVSSGRVG